MDDCAGESVVFVGLCQDHGREAVEYWMPLIEDHLSPCFQDYRVLFLENDSRDETRSVLLRAAASNPRVLVMCDKESPLNVKECLLGVRASSGDKERGLRRRVETMASLRDAYLDRVLRKWPSFTYMVVIDWDLAGSFSVEGFFHALACVRRSVADGVAVNSFYSDKRGSRHVFDTFPLLNHRECNAMHRDKRGMDVAADRKMRSALLYGQTRPVRVESAFGGVCIYSLDRVARAGSRYTIPRERRYCDIQCEHTSFHRDLRIYIDPWFVLLVERNLR